MRGRGTAQSSNSHPSCLAWPRCQAFTATGTCPRRVTAARGSSCCHSGRDTLSFECPQNLLIEIGCAAQDAPFPGGFAMLHQVKAVQARCRGMLARARIAAAWLAARLPMPALQETDLTAAVEAAESTLSAIRTEDELSGSLFGSKGVDMTALGPAAMSGRGLDIEASSATPLTPSFWGSGQVETASSSATPVPQEEALPAASSSSTSPRSQLEDSSSDLNRAAARKEEARSSILTPFMLQTCRHTRFTCPEPSFPEFCRNRMCPSCVLIYHSSSSNRQLLCPTIFQRHDLVCCCSVYRSFTTLNDLVSHDSRPCACREAESGSR